MKQVCTVSVVVALGLVMACGGGGGGSAENTETANSPPSQVEAEPTRIELLDSSPTEGSPAIDSNLSTLNFSHLVQTDLNMELVGNCRNFNGATLRRNLQDLSTGETDEVLDHHVTCFLDENSNYRFDAEGTGNNDDRYRATLSFATSIQSERAITVQDSITSPKETINDFFSAYVEGALLTDIEAPAFVDSLLVDLINELVEDEWENLTDPAAHYDVISERVTYSSRTPSGEPSDSLSGLISRPVVDDNFIQKDHFIILTHATGSTPSELNSSDAWYILANLFAARGYLVVAADNYGRGNTGTEEETYLLANQTSYNTLDLARQVLEDRNYSDTYDGQNASVIGYSQGGHTAIAVWLMSELQEIDRPSIVEVHAGGAPYNLYKTVRGVLSHLNGSCDDDVFCRYVDEATTVPFATNRIIPALLSYTETGFFLNDILINGAFETSFISGFLDNEIEYDSMKSLLQLNSFTDINNLEEIVNANVKIHLYHSEFDRLVPAANTAELVSILEAAMTVDHHQSRCNSAGYEAIFNLTDRVGFIHTLCGLSVLNDVLGDLR